MYVCVYVCSMYACMYAHIKNPLFTSSTSEKTTKHFLRSCEKIVSYYNILPCVCSQGMRVQKSLSLMQIQMKKA